MLNQNPILQAISGNTQNRNNAGISNLVNLVKGNPNAMFDQLMRTNPQFANFVNANRGKPVEQIAYENGLDMNTVKQFIK